MVKTLTRTALLAGLMTTGGLALAQDTPSAGPRSNVLYCSGCLCQETPPQTRGPGRWVPSGTMGSRTTMRWRPAEPPGGGHVASAGCRPPPRG
jgi:hypothetical protein